MKITNEWKEVPLSTANTWTRIQNTSGKVILLALSDSIPNDLETKNAMQLDYFREECLNKDTWVYDHHSDTRKLYIMGLYLRDGESANVSVY